VKENERAEVNPLPPSADSDGGFVIRHRTTIIFLVVVLCLAGGYAALMMPSSVFPQTDFPRVVILIDNGVMPADEMMATITRPVEEAMKDIPGTVTIRSSTGRGSAAVNVFFTWDTDMIQAELYVLGRLSQIRSSLPPSAEFAVHRLTFSAFPIIGISLVSKSKTRSITELWEKARYDLRPRFLRIRGVARVKLVGGRVPEYHVIVDPLRLRAYNLSLDDVTRALSETNEFTPAGMHEENHQLYLAVVDNRIRDASKIEDVVIAWRGASPIYVRDVASVRRGAAPRFNIVTADGSEAVLLNIYSQPDGSTLAIASALREELRRVRREYPPDMKLAFFYDQSLFVREGVKSVWESILVGLALSVLVLYLFLKSPATTFVAAAVIPVTVLITLVGMKLFRMSFNLMTLGGIAAAIGLIIDDAIVVVEAVFAKIQSGRPVRAAVRLAVREVAWPLVGSTLTPVVVFIPLAFLDGVPGVFFRALAVTMVLALLTSLLLAVTWTPALGSLVLRPARGEVRDELDQAGPVLGVVVKWYEWAVRRVLRFAPLAAVGILGIALLGVLLYRELETDFLPAQDEGAFVLDYYSRPGTSLSETDRMLKHVEEILRKHPAVESFSRRTGARLALAIAEPNTGDFLVKLKSERSQSTDEVKDELRKLIEIAEPALHTEFPGVLSDLIGDLTWSPKPVEIKVFSTDTALLKEKALEIYSLIHDIPGVVDRDPGLIVAGPSMRFRVLGEEAFRVGSSPRRVGEKLRTALLGTLSSYVLEGDRTVGVRVLVERNNVASERDIRSLPLRSSQGTELTVRDLTAVDHVPGILEMQREDLRQLVAVSANFYGIDMGTGMRLIQEKIAEKVKLPPDAAIEYGGLYKEQQESFRNLAFVLAMAIVLVYAVLLIEFRTLLHPLAIVAGSVLALFGVTGALLLTGTSLNIVSFLGAIIGVGIVAKNGILMLDFVRHLRERGFSLYEALVQSGRRRLRPVLMTSMTTFLGLLPLAYGVGAGADMLKPLAIAVMGSLVMSLVLSLVATPVCYYLLVRVFGGGDTASRSNGGRS